MKLITTLLFITHFCSAQVWVQLGNYPGQQRDDGVAVVVNNKAYFGTGLIEWASTIDFHVLDLSTYSWSSMPNMPNTKERQYACAFAGTHCFYVFGGDGVGGALNNMFKYDIATSTWTAMASKPGSGLIGAVCMPFGDKVIVSGGKNQTGKASAEVWEYTISTDSWLQKNNYAFIGRWRASAAVLNGSGYLLFGLDTGGAYRKEFYKYEPSTDNWIKIMDFPMALGRAYAALQVANNHLFLFGGQDTLQHLYKDSWCFKESSATWSSAPDLPSTGRRGGMSCAAGDRFFYSCGIAEGPMRVNETWMTDVPLSIKESSTSNRVSVYPNPSSGLIYFDVTLPQKTLTCIYTNACGAELGRTETVDSQRSVDLSAFDKGVYILKFYSEKQLIAVKKIVKN